MCRFQKCLYLILWMLPRRVTGFAEKSSSPLLDFCQPITDVYCGQLTNESVRFLKHSIFNPSLVNFYGYNTLIYRPQCSFLVFQGCFILDPFLEYENEQYFSILQCHVTHSLMLSPFVFVTVFKIISSQNDSVCVYNGYY